LLLGKREIFSLLVFGGQYVLNKIGFVSQFRGGINARGASRDAEVQGRFPNEKLKMEKAASYARVGAPQSKTQLASLKYDFLIVIRAFYQRCGKSYS
jgi:hypothetical protein